MAPDDRLDSWKEIAAYLKRDVTTVQRWEKREGMPVRRHLHGKLGSVYAFRSELDAWAQSRSETGTEVPALPPVPPGPASEPHASRSRPRLWLVTAGVVLLAGIGSWRMDRADYFWRSPLRDARFEQVANLTGSERAAALSRDGRLVAFLSDHDGQTDVWIAQVGTDLATNLTKGRIAKLSNQSVRSLGFSPDGALVTFWADMSARTGTTDIGIWAIPSGGGDPRPYLPGAAEFDWSPDASRLVYHTTAPGDPTFVRQPEQQRGDAPIFTSAAGQHCHYQTWSPDGAFIYFVQGTLPDGLDVWRMRPDGSGVERMTSHHSRVSHPVLLDPRTLLYLATDADGSGPWLYTMDTEYRVAHRLETALDRYTSLAASADRRRLVLSLASPKSTLWRVGIDAASPSAPASIAIPAGRARSPRIGDGYLLYVSGTSTGDTIWKFSGGIPTALWTSPGARIVGAPDIAGDGRIAFAADESGRTALYVMAGDGTGVRRLNDGLQLDGAPAWAPDGQAIAIGAVVDRVTRLMRVDLRGVATPMTASYSVEPAWSPEGSFIVYSGADVGTEFELGGLRRDGQPYPLPSLRLPRGGRRVHFLEHGQALAVMRGDLEHKDIWRIDLRTGEERLLARFAADFKIRDFDISPDGREMVVERVLDHSEIVLVNRGGS